MIAVHYLNIWEYHNETFYLVNFIQAEVQSG